MWLALAAAASAALYFFLLANGVDDALTFVKPLPALFLAIELLRAHRPVARLMAVGLVFAAGGDAALQRQGDVAFAVGMVCFIAQHCAYIAAFVQAGRQSGAHLTPRYPRLACVAWYALALIVLLALIPRTGMMAVPLLVYTGFLLTMAVMALLVIYRPGGAAVAVGACVFIASDLLIALTRFYPPFPLHGDTAQYAINASYYAAQLLLALGFSRVAASLPEHAAVTAQ